MGPGSVRAPRWRWASRSTRRPCPRRCWRRSAGRARRPRRARPRRWRCSSSTPVVGVKGIFDRRARSSPVGITCALCHSTVDDRVGAGHRPAAGRLGQPRSERRRDRRPGARPRPQWRSLLGVDEATRASRARRAGGRGASTPSCSSTARPSVPTARPARHPACPRPTGWPASICTPRPAGARSRYWNAFVANLEMHGKGVFYDPRLNDRGALPGRGRRRVRRRAQRTKT
ncbi:MAG: hypothetical protein MZV70_37445 [Desulfobacterales bacterium]|nr:hypothetical protein [Desulfobacterales bacterium]